MGIIVHITMTGRRYGPPNPFRCFEVIASGIIGQETKKENVNVELLDALKLAQATIERVNPKVHESCNGTLDVLHAAIQKAEG